MRTSNLLLLSIAIILAGCATDADSDSRLEAEASAIQSASMQETVHDPGHILFQNDSIEWQNGPGSFQEGSQFAVLEGDPSVEGVFTMRIRMPDGFVISPHFHPQPERLTVLEGTFLLGSGDAFVPDEVQPLRTGAYTSMPPGMRHFAIAEGETVIQLTSTGPWEITYVNEADDPRRASR